MKRDPSSWLGDPSLEVALEALKAEASGRTELPDAVRNSVRVRLEASLAGLTAAPGGLNGTSPRPSDPGLDSMAPPVGPVGAPAAGSPAIWLSGAGKVLLGSLVAGGVALVAGVWLAGPAPRSAPMPPAESTMASQSPGASSLLPGAPESPAREVLEVLLKPVEDGPREGVTGETLNFQASATTKPLRRGGVESTGMKPSGPAGDLNYELTLLRLARVALSDRPAFARELLRNYDKRFPTGALRKEYELLLKRIDAADPAAPSLEKAASR